jgi:hypothetical protein
MNTGKTLFAQLMEFLPWSTFELRAADGEQPADPMAVQRYLAKALGDHLDGLVAKAVLTDEQPRLTRDAIWQAVTESVSTPDIRLSATTTLRGSGSMEPKVRFRLESGPSGEVRRTASDPSRSLSFAFGTALPCPFSDIRDHAAELRGRVEPRHS